MGDFLITSVIASIVLTVIVNVGLWLAASRKQRAADVYQSVPPPVDPTADGQRRRSSVRVFFPWKWMLALSIGLTVILNLVAALS